MSKSNPVPSHQNVLLQLSKDNRVATLTLNRPQSGNSMHPDMLTELYSALHWADNHLEIRIIIITGAGHFFNTGMELIDGSGTSFDADSKFRNLNRLLILSEKILIAAVNGPAAGYGVSSLGLFDLVFSVPDAYFFTPFVKWGMAAEGASSFSFPRLMGYQKTALMFLVGERISAAEAEKLGLVSRILEKESFLKCVTDVAEKMAQQPWGALKATKSLMRAPLMKELLDANDRECKLISEERFGFEEYNEAIKQFKVEQEEKRRRRSKL